jgi:ATP-dependent DNA ligase
MHPKTEIKPTPASIEKILKAGWVGQMKVHGHRAQVHIAADESVDTIVYNRQGRPHKKLLPDDIIVELRRIFHLEDDWTVIDAEWLKPEGLLFIFDLLKLDGKSLRSQSYKERYDLLPKAYISPVIKTLPLLTTLNKCFDVLESKEKYVEGLVFKAPHSKGFEDTSIVRCRRR